jgi:hypothetical protein
MDVPKVGDYLIYKDGNRGDEFLVVTSVKNGEIQWDNLTLGLSGREHGEYETESYFRRSRYKDAFRYATEEEVLEWFPLDCPICEAAPIAHPDYLCEGCRYGLS